MNTNQSYYLDFAASTPVDPRVLESMLPYFSEYFGNPSSTHIFGQKAEAALEESRETMAHLLGCHPDEIVFTSGGTESDNLAIRGGALFRRMQSGSGHILITPVEHHAVRHTAEQLAYQFGFELEILPVDTTGIVDLDVFQTMLRPDTAIVSVIYANNEIGTLNPIREMSEICHERGILFHTDAVQAAAHYRMAMDQVPIDLLSIGAHKFYGPKGVGALVIRREIELLSTQTGGGQERGRRAGTSNVPYIVGMAKALELVQTGLDQRAAYLLQLRDRIIHQVLDSIPNTQLTGHPSLRLPNHASFVFKGVDGNILLMLLDTAGYACSSGSACKTGDPEPSDVLIALGYPREWSLGSLRVTLGTNTTADVVDGFLQVLPDAVAKARALSIVGVHVG